MKPSLTSIEYYLDNIRVNGKPLSDIQKSRYKKEIKRGNADLILTKRRARR
jgi:hypothetical protein